MKVEEPLLHSGGCRCGCYGRARRAWILLVRLGMSGGVCHSRAQLPQAEEGALKVRSNY